MKMQNWEENFRRNVEPFASELFINIYLSIYLYTVLSVNEYTPFEK